MSSCSTGSSGGSGSSGAAQQSTTPQASTSISITKDDLHLGGAPCQIQAPEVSGLLGIAYLAAGIVAVFALIYAGIRYATANGDSGQIQSAKNVMFYAIVGLVVILGAAALTQFVITQVTQ